MSEYTLTVNLNDEWRKRWAKEGSMKLCIATAIQSGSSSYANVVAYTASVSPYTTITWSEKFKIGATDSQFSDGAKFESSSDIIDVKFGSKTVVTKDWDIKTNPDSAAPENGFLFTNERIAAAVLYKEIKGDYRPVYISHIGRLPLNSIEKMVPNPKVYVWYSSDYETGTMIDSSNSQRFEITMDKKSKSVTFDAVGNWIMN